MRPRIARSVVTDDALREAMNRAFDGSSFWRAADGRTKAGRLQRDAARRGLVAEFRRMESDPARYALTMKGREFINAG